MSRNLAASVRARLKQRADASQQDFNLTLTHYGLERLLYRLSISPHAPNFLLKGALLFSLWYDRPHRPTRDADLLGFGPDDVHSAVTTFREICQIAVEDGIAFDAASVKGAEIREEAGYGGVRIVAALEALLRTKEVVVENAEVVWRAVRNFRDSSGDFADCLVERSAAAAGCERTMTFDKAAAKNCGMTLIQ